MCYRKHNVHRVQGVPVHQLLPLAIGLGASYLIGHGGTNETKLRRVAKSYIKRKYGFSAKAGEVMLDSIGWLEPKWHKGRSGVVTMTYEGTTFYVMADRKAGVTACTDTYQKQEFTARILDPLKQQLANVYFHVSARYGDLRFPGGYVGLNVNTFEDLVAQGGIEVCVSAYGLDESTIRGLDFSHLGANVEVGVFCWRNRKAVDAAYAPYNIAIASDTDTIYLTDHYRLKDGSWTHKTYEQLEAADVSFAYPAGLDVRIVPTVVNAGDDNLSTPATSAWYELSTTSDQEIRVMVFPHVTETNRTIKLQLWNPSTGELTQSATDIPSYLDDHTTSPAIIDFPYHTCVWLNLTSKKGWVQRGPKTIRIL